MRRRCRPPPLPLLIAAGHRCRGVSGRLPLSQGTPTSAAGAGGARTPPAPHPDSQNRPASFSSPMLQTYVQLLQMFQRYVASISYRCCKNRSGYCICCNGYTRMFQASVLNVSSVFSDVCCKSFYLDIVYVSYICLLVFLLGRCICFAMTFSSALGVFISVSDL
jgi:hypothetical protein